MDPQNRNQSRFWRLAPLLLATLLVGPLLAETEPNDSVAEAEPAQVGSWIQLACQAAGDADFLALDLARPTVLRWEAEGAPGKPWVGFWWDGERRRGGEAAGRVPAGKVQVEVRMGAPWDFSKVASDTPYRFRLVEVPEPDPTEPNDSLEAPARVPLGEWITVASYPRRDRDYLRLDLPRPGILAYQLEGAPGEPQVILRDLAGKALRGGGERDARVAAGPLIADLRTSRWESSEKASTTPWRIRFDLRDDPDPTEPNDVLASAPAAPLGEWITVASTPRLDRDYLRLEIPAGGILRYATEGAPTKTMQIFLRDAAGKELRGGGERDARVAAGPVWADLRTAYWEASEKSVATPWKIRFDLAPDPDPTEPNETLETAHPVALGEWITVATVPRLDRDYLKLTIPRAGILRYEVEGAPGDGLVFLRAPDGTEVRDGGERDARVGPGVVIADLRTSRWGASERASADPWRLRFTLAEDPDPTEPNDTLETATEVPLGEWVTVAFFPRADRDFLKLAIPRAGILRYRLEGAPRDTLVTLLDASGEVQRAGGERDAEVAAGTQLVELRSSRWASTEKSSSTPWRIRFDLDGDPDPTEPNDTPEDAHPVEFDTWVTLATYPRADRDLLRLDLPEAGEVTWEADGCPGEPVIAPLGADGTRLHEGVRRGTHLPMGAAIYEVRTSRWASAEVGSPIPWKVRFRFRPAASLRGARDGRRVTYRFDFEGGSR